MGDIPRQDLEVQLLGQLGGFRKYERRRSLIRRMTPSYPIMMNEMEGALPGHLRLNATSFDKYWNVKQVISRSHRPRGEHNGKRQTRQQGNTYRRAPVRSDIPVGQSTTSGNRVATPRQ